MADPRSSDAEADHADDARATKWAARVVAWVCLLSVAPLAYYVGTNRRGEIRNWVAGTNATWLDTEKSADPATQLRGMTTGLGYVVVFCGLAVFIVAMWLRRMATRRLIRRAAGGDVSVGPFYAMAYSATGWTALFVAAAVGGTLVVAGGKPNTSDIAQHFIDQPLWMALALPGFVLALGASQFFHQERYGLLPAAAEPPVPPETSDGPLSGFVEGTRALVRAVVIEAGVGAFLLVESWTEPGTTDYNEFAASRVFGVILVPAVYASVFLLLFAVMRPTRWIVRRCLSKPLTIASLTLMGGGVALAAAGAPLPISGGAIVIGGIIGSVTGLYLQDVGRQPFLGLLFMVFVYSSSFHNGSAFVLPTSVVGWLLVVATTVYALLEARKHWRHSYPARVASS